MKCLPVQDMISGRGWKMKVKINNACQRINSNLGKELTYGSYNIVTLNYKYVETPDNQM